MKRSIIIGTAGHIDHGKTALVKALTGVDTDRLPEEKARGITIDLGFAHADWNGIDVSFIDVPGHERFIKNMLAGIGGIDLLMLIVAADESVMPQTREHFEICRLLQIPDGIVVITKKDLVEEETILLVEAEIKELVKDSFLKDAPVHAVSAVTGDGLPDLREALLSKFRNQRSRVITGPFRLPVDRVFTLKGHGTVVTGTLISGKVRKENLIDILPSGKRARIRSIHAHDTPVEEAVSGQRTALNLQGIEKEEINRGDVLVSTGIFQPTSLLNVKLMLLKQARPLLHNALVRFHHLTNDVACRVTLLGTAILNPGESCYAQLRLQSPVHALYSDRFILRKHSPLTTIGGGVILDHLPVRRASTGDTKTIERLQLLEQEDPGQRLALAVLRKGFAGAEESYLKAKMGMEGSELSKIIVPEVRILRSTPLLAIHSDFETELIQRILSAVNRYHDQNPLQFGISKEELRSKFSKNVPQDVFASVLEQMIGRRQLQIQKDLLAVFGRRVALDQSQEELSLKIEQHLQRTGLDTPRPEELAKALNEPLDKTRNILYLLVREKKAIKIADDYFLHRQAWEELKGRILSLKNKRKTFSVPDFKALFGITRKYAIPLLENLDREGITRRSGNERIIL